MGLASPGLGWGDSVRQPVNVAGQAMAMDSEPAAECCFRGQKRGTRTGQTLCSSSKESLDSGLCKRSRKLVVFTYPFGEGRDTGKVWGKKDHRFEGLFEKARQEPMKYWQMDP